MKQELGLAAALVLVTGCQEGVWTSPKDHIKVRLIGLSDQDIEHFMTGVAVWHARCKNPNVFEVIVTDTEAPNAVNVTVNGDYHHFYANADRGFVEFEDRVGMPEVATHELGHVLQRLSMPYEGSEHNADARSLMHVKFAAGTPLLDNDVKFACEGRAL